MKNIFLPLLCVFCCISAFAEENLTVTKMLEQKYGYVRYTDKDDKILRAGISFYQVKHDKNDKTMGLCDGDGREIVPPGKYESVRYYWHRGSFREPIIMVNNGKKYGWLNYNGEVIFEPGRYDFIRDDGAYFHVTKGDKYGVCNKNGKEIIPPGYDNIYLAGIGFDCSKKGKSNMLNLAGKPFFQGFSVEYLYYNIEKSDLEYSSKENSPTIKLSEHAPGFLNFFIPAAKAYMADYPFSEFAKYYVTYFIDQWQCKGEFEGVEQWRQRISDDNRNAKIAEFAREAEKLYVSQRHNLLPRKITLGAYDADNQSYVISSLVFSDLFVRVPREQAEEFKRQFDNMNKVITYGVNNDAIDISRIEFRYNNIAYVANKESDISYTLASIEYNFAPVEISGAGSAAQQKGSRVVSEKIAVGQSDVDINIPVSSIKRDKTFAVIIANENYQRESQVLFAKNDGAIFKEYCSKTLGIPDKNIRFVPDATLNNIRGEINWLSQVADAYNGEANIIFYYAGHGIPDESSKSAYLLPVDGYGSDVTTGYKIDDLYAKLGGLSAKMVTVFMDACFSGAQRNGTMLASARGVAIKATQGVPLGNMVVFSAAQGDETAYPLTEQGHGLFTYYILKKLQETKGDVTLGELDSYIVNNVRQQSIVVNGKSQTPTVVSSTAWAEKWREFKLLR